MDSRIDRERLQELRADIAQTVISNIMQKIREAERLIKSRRLSGHVLKQIAQHLEEAARAVKLLKAFANHVPRRKILQFMKRIAYLARLLRRKGYVPHEVENILRSLGYKHRIARRKIPVSA